SWDSILRRPLERICHFLFNAYDGTDVANLAKVSRHYKKKGVMKFMSEPKNRPGIDRLGVRRNRNDLVVDMTLFRSNLPFYGLASLDKKRFRQLRTFTCPPMLRVTLSGPQDSIIEKKPSLLN
ncbi:hypothetical protein PMAYCL1PPCAC_25488, partial [Pristionchus mayeri]